MDVTVDQVGTFESAMLAGERFVAFGVGPHDDAIALVVGRPEWDRNRSPDDAPQVATVVRDRSTLDRIVLDGTPPSHPNIQPLPDDQVLIVDARTELRRDGTYDLNARVYGPDGALRREFLLGDGIEDVQTTPNGDIWVSYFDEGVYGNLGWGKAGGPEPIGAPGLIRWRPDGTIAWRFEPPDPDYPIDDCYALNVTPDATWACYYSEFPLVRIAPDGTMRTWLSPISGARALGIGREHAVFFGGYRDDRQRCVLAEFGERSLTEKNQLRLWKASGEPLLATGGVGRGPFLHFLDGPDLYRLDVRTLE
jgi:hypothetical protein